MGRFVRYRPITVTSNLLLKNLQYVDNIVHAKFLPASPPVSLQVFARELWSVNQEWFKLRQDAQ
jgi:hypothetical protein